MEEKVDVLFDRKMSGTIGKLAEALAKFQGEVANPSKDAVNPYFKSKYATLDAILKEVRPKLAKYDLAIIQLPEEGSKLTTLLMHKSGEFIKGTIAMKPTDEKPQSLGSAMTYARRYSISALLGIAADEDEDGNAASQEPKVRTVKRIQHEDYKGEPVVQTEPEAEKNKTEELRARITKHLEVLGYKGQAKPKVRAAILDMTQLEPVEENYEAIERALAILADNKAEFNE